MASQGSESDILNKAGNRLAWITITMQSLSTANFDPSRPGAEEEPARKEPPWIHLWVRWSGGLSTLNAP